MLAGVRQCSRFGMVVLSGVWPRLDLAHKRTPPGAADLTPLIRL